MFGFNSSSSIVAAIFSDESAAVHAAAALGNVGLRSYRHVLLIPIQEGGDSLAVWSARLVELGARVLVENPAEEKSIVAFIECQAPTLAAVRALQKELKLYFDTPYYMNVRAPWEPPADAADAERSARIQITNHIFQEATRLTMQHPQLRARMSKMLFNPASMFRIMRDRRAMQGPFREMDLLSAQIRQEIIQRLAAEQQVQLDEELLNLLGSGRGVFLGTDPSGASTGGPLDFSSIGGFDFSILAGIMPLAANYQPSPLWAHCASVEVSRQQLILDMVSFASIASGLPALLDYLLAKGCTDLNFRLEDDDDERVD
ncbi:MAG: hypothetical protein HY866_21330 [Chloroflexi bacterium]|nr:hypothetical protein [Chloroflexota bacterium]